MEKIDQFRETNRGIILAPAGYGKTYSICECINLNIDRSLVLTHTNAGIGSIKQKMCDNKIPNNLFDVETISGFIQRLVISLSINKNPNEPFVSEYYDFFLIEATKLLDINVVQDVIRANYIDLYVDEYQDCTILQHQFINTIANIIPIHILGDPLQSIFNFDKVQIDWEEDLKDFEIIEKLEIPWRWKEDNPMLGDSLDRLRNHLEATSSLNLKDFIDEANFLRANQFDLNDVRSDYYKWVLHLIDTHKQLLIIHPESTSLAVRLKFVKRFGNRLNILESIDSKDFYKFSRAFDESSELDLVKQVIHFSRVVFKKSEISKWFNDTTVKNKRSDNDKCISLPLKKYLDEVVEGKDFLKIAEILEYINNLPNNICYRKELLRDIIKALNQARVNDTDVYTAMTIIRNTKRRSGRCIEGRNVGTTLLTKGLEFQNVLVLDADKFKDKNNFYVALTRAKKNLYVISQYDEISFDNNQQNDTN